jgi:hypothetical protein
MRDLLAKPRLIHTVTPDDDPRHDSHEKHALNDIGIREIRPAIMPRY